MLAAAGSGRALAAYWMHAVNAAQVRTFTTGVDALLQQQGLTGGSRVADTILGASSPIPSTRVYGAVAGERSAVIDAVAAISQLASQHGGR